MLNADMPVFPGRGGIEFLHTTLMAGQVERLGLVSLSHSDEHRRMQEVLRQAGVELYLWENPQAPGTPSQPVGRRPRSWIRKRGRQAFDLLRSSSSRPQDTLIQDLQFRNVSEQVRKALEEVQWQAIIIVQSNCAHWLDSLPSVPVKALMLHDVRARVFERMAEISDTLADKILARLEAMRYRSFEDRYLRQFDLIITVSSEDEAWVRSRYSAANVWTIPIPVDAGYFAPHPAEEEVPNLIMFPGMMNHPPNVDAACFFATEVLPVVQDSIPEAEFVIVGRDPTPAVRELEKIPGVSVTGFVPDIRPYLAQASVVVVPLRFGAGMRQKILEAWSMEKCIVSTTIGAEGLEYQNSEEIIIADGKAALSEKVVAVLQDSDLRQRIRSKGRQVVLTKHDPVALAQRYVGAVTSEIRLKQSLGDPMRALIDLRWMYPGVAGGIESLSRSFLNSLLKLDRTNEYVILMPAEVTHDFDLRGHTNIDLIAEDGLGMKLHRFKHRLARYTLRRLGLDYWQTYQVENLRRIHQTRAEVALSIPGYIHPELYVLPNVLVVPDIQHEVYPQFFTAKELEERRRLYTQSINKASQLCAISEFTRQTLIDRLGVSPDRVTTTHLAADPRFHPHAEALDERDRVLRKYHLEPFQYFLFPGHTWYHKNHRIALKAMQILRDVYRLKLSLVCTGGEKHAHPGLLELVAALGLDDQVRFLGYCPDQDMPGLYRGAAALLFPSLFEGFGMPILEAMWCDCPVVCSDASSLPEIAGDAALLVDPNSAEGFAEALHNVVTDMSLRAELKRRGGLRAREFGWSRFSLQIVQALYEIRQNRLR